MKVRFRSTDMRKLYKEAVAQGFRPIHGPRAPHVYLLCPHPDCHYRQTLSTTDTGVVRNLKNYIADLRRHGLIWQGRGGKHTAPVLNRLLSEAEDTTAA